MKKFSKILSVALLVALVLSFGAMAFADAGDAITATKGTITVQNAAMGETYKLFKVFEATISKVEGANGTSDSVAYTFSGELPSTLAAAFEKIGTTDYVKRIDEKTDAEVLAAVNAYVATLADSAAVASQNATGGPVVFENLDFGYYAVKSTQGANVTIDSANPNAVIYDKNSKTITVDKTVDGTSYSIGDTITYTAAFDTVNWLGNGKDAKQVIEYTIADTLPEFLDPIAITSVIIYSKVDDPATADVNEAEVAANLSSDYTKFTSKQITIPWADKTSTDPVAYTSKYPNGAKLVITYTAKLTSVTNINAVDTNTVSIHPKVWNGTETEEPWDDKWQDDAEIITYAAALKKTDGAKALAGAKFAFYGLTVEKTADGIYTVVSYDPSKYNTGDGATQVAANLGTEMEVDANGKLYVVGLKSGITLHGIETEAPAGYNKLTTEATMTPEVLSKEVYKTSGTIHYDAKGNVTSTQVKEEYDKVVEKNLSELDGNAVEIVNNKGAELPSTGGIGTTIFYVVGGVLVLAAIILLVTKKRMSE